MLPLSRKRAGASADEAALYHLDGHRRPSFFRTRFLALRRGAFGDFFHHGFAVAPMVRIAEALQYAVESVFDNRLSEADIISAESVNRGFEQGDIQSVKFP